MRAPKTGARARGDGALMRARLFLILPLLAGCTVGPDYHKPDIATPDTFAAENAPLSVPLAAQADMTRWWTLFHDPELESLIARALGANLDLQAAASRVREARQQEIIADAAGEPSFSASGNALDLHSGRNFLSQLTGNQSPVRPLRALRPLPAAPIRPLCVGIRRHLGD